MSLKPLKPPPLHQTHPLRNHRGLRPPSRHGTPHGAEPLATGTFSAANAFGMIPLINVHFFNPPQALKWLSFVASQVVVQSLEMSEVSSTMAMVNKREHCARRNDTQRADCQCHVQTVLVWVIEATIISPCPERVGKRVSLCLKRGL